MGSYSELSLDLNPCYISKMISGFTREVSVIKDPSEKLLKVQDILKSLEEERKKIEAFKRELPFCMVLVIEAIEAVKEEEKKCRLLAEKARPVLEEFMLPVKSKLDGGRGVESEKDNRDKMNWMSSVQLWSDTNGNSNKNKLVGDLKEKPEEQKQSALENSFLLCKNKSNGGAFTPFKGLSGFPAKKEEKEVLTRPEISLLSPIIKNPNADSGIGSSNLKSGIKSTAFASAMNIQSNSQQQQQMQIPRKQRRCWSPELHKRFLSALNELGGSQAATPKQIRELMKVDGLTNDEVKSHLQVLLYRGRFKKELRLKQKRDHGEGLQILHYEVGRKYESHYDYFLDDYNTKNGGQRIAIVLMYLSDVEEGGETVFPAAKRNFSSVSWWNELSSVGRRASQSNHRGGMLCFSRA